ncbi:MAG: hypothetical protein OEX04_16565 [Acidimicrobiia bacterium]|nr:hypothetical protein [Acidimicrobiia bacterium]MDH4309082.1 hypothetical protein [Acidimicrobiia bacterium]MDH5292479.1 hypothetical protein [Acidimicrobiia bacterium]
MTPVTIRNHKPGPVFPLVGFDPSANPKSELPPKLAAHGVTCDEILAILDDVRANRDRLRHWFRIG